jgi:hypothetical protein
MGCGRMGGSPEGGEFGDCFLLVAVGIAPCPPPTLSGVDHASVAGLGCGLCLASDPHGLPGLEVAALRVDCHGLGSFDLWLV